MNANELRAAVAALRTSGFAHMEAGAGPFAALVAALIPAALAAAFAGRAQSAIDAAQQTLLDLPTPDLAGRSAAEIDANGIDIDMVPGPHALSINVKPELIAFASGKTQTPAIGSLTLTETFEIDLSDLLRGAAFDATITATLTVKTTGTRNAASGAYDVESNGSIDLDISAALGAQS